MRRWGRFRGVAGQRRLEIQGEASIHKIQKITKKNRQLESRRKTTKDKPKGSQSPGILRKNEVMK